MKPAKQSDPSVILWDEINALIAYARQLQNNLGWPSRFPLPAIQQLELTRVLERDLTVKDLRAVLSITKCALNENDLPDFHRQFFAQAAEDIAAIVQSNPQMFPPKAA